MFCILKEDNMDTVFELLATYAVTARIIIEDNETYMLIKAVDDASYDDLRLAEMAFQFNFHQKNGACLVCAANGEKFCGHLTFTEKIKPLF